MIIDKGDVVRYKHGGPLMTVDIRKPAGEFVQTYHRNLGGFNRKFPSIRCIWHDKNDVLQLVWVENPELVLEKVSSI